MANDDAFGSNPTPIIVARDIPRVAEIMRKRIAEAIQIGENGTAGDFTDVGLTHKLLQDLGLVQ